LSDVAELLRAAAALLWVVVALVVVFIVRSLLSSRKGPLTKLGLGPGGATFEFAEAKLDEAVAKSDEETRTAIGNAAKRSVIARLESHADLLARARILWVDDHPANNTPLADLLRQYGATVDTPRSNSEALALLGTTRYDVVISDVARDDEGPNSDLKGVELAQTVFERWGQRVVLFTSRFNPARLPDASDKERLELVAVVDKSVFARTNRTDEALHYILDLVER